MTFCRDQFSFECAQTEYRKSIFDDYKNLATAMV